MKIRTIVYAIILQLSGFGWAASSHAVVEISGYIDSDTTWTDLETILVTGNVTVESSGSLVIEAGATALFNPGTGLYINGSLTADGASYKRIVFTSSADTVGGTPEAGSWVGIWFQENSGGLLLNCDLRYAENCIYAYKSSPTLNRCTTDGFLNHGVYIDGHESNPPITPIIKDCVISQSEQSMNRTGTGIFAYRSVEVTISGCMIGNCLYGLQFKGSGTITPHFTVTSCEIRDNVSHGIFCRAGG